MTEVFSRIVSYIFSYRFLTSLITIAVGIFLGISEIKISSRYIKKHNDDSGSVNIHFLNNIFRFVLVAIVLVLLLQIHGINVSSIVAGLGIAGITVGFALQDYLKDFMMGFTIALDHFYVVGDVIRYKNTEGKTTLARVTDFNLKVTKLYDIETENTFTVCNRNISAVEIVSTFMGIDVPAPYEIEAERMRAICKNLAEQISRLDAVEQCYFAGTKEFAESNINYLLKVYCPPEHKLQTRREILGLIQDKFAEENISIPYQHIIVHTSKTPLNTEAVHFRRQNHASSR